MSDADLVSWLLTSDGDHSFTEENAVKTRKAVDACLNALRVAFHKVLDEKMELVKNKSIINQNDNDVNATEDEAEVK